LRHTPEMHASGQPTNGLDSRFSPTPASRPDRAACGLGGLIRQFPATG
jgi:hypothetical protein